MTSLRGDVRIPKAARKKFWGVIAPLAPWVFAAPALAFAVGPSLVADQLGDQQVAFATLVTVPVLGVGTLTQLFSRRSFALFRARNACRSDHRRY